MLLELWLCDVRVVTDGARYWDELLRDCWDSGAERVAEGVSFDARGSSFEIGAESEAGVEDSEVDIDSDWTGDRTVAIELAPTDSGFAET